MQPMIIDYTWKWIKPLINNKNINFDILKQIAVEKLLNTNEMYITT